MPSKQNLRAVCLCLITFFSLFGCKLQSTTQLQHEFGKTRVEPYEMIDCNRLLPADPTFPQATQYLKQIIEHIAISNPDTFRDAYEAKSFCVDIQEGPFNAYADPETGMITVFSGVIKQASNDAEVAAVLSHELAHVTMQHTDMMTQADLHKMGEDGQTQVYARFDLMFDLDELMVQLEEEQKIVTELNKSSIKNNDKLHRSYQNIQNIESQIQEKKRDIDTATAAVQATSRAKLGDPQQVFGSIEREADEVGFEFYLRARFHPAAFGTVMRNFYPLDLVRQQAEFLKCLARITFPVGAKPTQGTEFHPSPCWRLYNIASGEQQRHREDYKPFLRNATLTSLDGGQSLRAAQNEIRGQ